MLRALLERIAARPGGGAQLARINDLDARGAETPPPRATFGLAALCVAVYALEALTQTSRSSTPAYMSLALVRDGDLHRIVTANLIHAFALHLVFNLLCLLAVGRMLERAIGSERVVCVMGASALGAMAATGWLRDASVVGVSGVVFGLAAGLLWVELRCAEALPAWWRFPRRALLWICGALLRRLGARLRDPARRRRGAPGRLRRRAARDRAGDAALARARVAGRASARAAPCSGSPPLAVLAAAVTLALPGDFRVRHALRVAQLPGVSAEELNDRAWLLATRRSATPEELAVALSLARARGRGDGAPRRHHPRHAGGGAVPARTSRARARDHRRGDRARAGRELLPRAAAPLPRRARPRRPARSAAAPIPLGRRRPSRDAPAPSDAGITV